MRTDELFSLGIVSFVPVVLKPSPASVLPTAYFLGATRSTTQGRLASHLPSLCSCTSVCCLSSELNTAVVLPIHHAFPRIPIIPSSLGRTSLFSLHLRTFSGQGALCARTKSVFDSCRFFFTDRTSHPQLRRCLETEPLINPCASCFSRYLLRQLQSSHRHDAHVLDRRRALCAFVRRSRDEELHHQSQRGSSVAERWVTLLVQVALVLPPGSPPCR